MNIERRLVDALSEFDRVEPSRDLFARVEESVARDRLIRRRVRRLSAFGVLALSSVIAFFALAGDAGSISGWAVFGAQLVILGAAVVALGRVIPRFGHIYVSEVFRLDPVAGNHFLRLIDVAYHLVFGGYVLILSWHRQMAGSVEIGEAIRFLLDRTAGLFLLMGLLHAATLLALPVIGLVFGTIVRDHARITAGHGAPPEDPRARQASRWGRRIVWMAAALVVVVFVLGLGLVTGLGISSS